MVMLVTMIAMMVVRALSPRQSRKDQLIAVPERSVAKLIRSNGYEWSRIT